MVIGSLIANRKDEDLCDVEGEIDLEGELLCALDEIRRLKKENSQQIFFALEEIEAVKKDLEERNQVIISLEAKVEEGKKRE